MKECSLGRQTFYSEIIKCALMSIMFGAAALDTQMTGSTCGTKRPVEF